MATVSPRPSDPAVARAFASIDPTALPTSNGAIVNGEDPDAIPNRCRDVTAALCEVLERLGIDTCEVYLFVDHRLCQVDLARALEVWRHEAEVEGMWGHVVLGVPGRRGANRSQLEGVVCTSAFRPLATISDGAENVWTQRRHARRSAAG